MRRGALKVSVSTALTSVPARLTTQSRASIARTGSAPLATSTATLRASKMADIGERLAAAISCVAVASGTALLASALCLTPRKAALWTERTINWALRIQAFIAGLLLASTFLAALPFVNFAFHRLLDYAKVTANYPLAEFAVCFGFLVVWGVHLACASATSIRRTCCEAPPVSIEMQAKKQPPQPPPPPPKVADISSSEEDVLYDAGEAWTPLNGPTPPTPSTPEQMEESDDSEAAVAAKLLNDSTVTAAAAARAAEEAEYAQKAGESFFLCFGHLGLLFGLIAAIPGRASIWMLTLAAAGHALLAVHRLCAALVAHYMPVLVFGFCFLCLTISSSSGLAVGFFLHAKEFEIPFQVISCLVWSLATGSQLYNACILTLKLSEAKLPSIQHFLGICAAFVVMSLLRVIGP